MTDAELTKLAATAVMGWEVLGHEQRFDNEEWILPANGAAPLENPVRLAKWQPLTDWRAAGEIVDKMRSDVWQMEVNNWNGKAPDDIIEIVWSKGGREGYSMDASGPRAITLAALLAVRAITESDLVASAGEGGV